MTRTVLVRADSADLPAASEAWRGQFENDSLFAKTRPDTGAVEVTFDPDVRERYERRRDAKREVRRYARKHPDVMRKFGAHAGDETHKRREQERLEQLAMEDKAERAASTQRDREIAARLAHAELHWQGLSTGGKRQNPHLAGRLIYTKMVLKAAYVAGTGTVPGSLRTPKAIAAVAGVSRKTVETELAMLHDAGWIKVDGIRKVPGRHTFGAEITLPPVDDGTLSRPGSVGRLLEQMELVSWIMPGSLAAKMLYVYWCSHPQTSWNHREDQRYSPLVERDAVSAGAIRAATGLHRETTRDARQELVERGLLRDLGHDLEITDPLEVPSLLEARGRARLSRRSD